MDALEELLLTRQTVLFDRVSSRSTILPGGDPYLIAVAVAKAALAAQ